MELSVSGIIFKTRSNQIRIIREHRDAVSGRERRENVGTIRLDGKGDPLRLNGTLSDQERRMVDERVARLAEQRAEIERGTVARLSMDMARTAEMIAEGNGISAETIDDIQSAARDLISACKRARNSATHAQGGALSQGTTLGSLPGSSTLRTAG